MLWRNWLKTLPIVWLCATGPIATADQAIISKDSEHTALALSLSEAINNAETFKDKFAAEVWLTLANQELSRFIKEPTERLEIARKIHREASRAGLSPDMVLALIEVESTFNRFAISRSGAQGLMQVMPFWKNEIGRPEDNLTDIDTNLKYGCHILKFYLDKEKGNLRPALARYNGSYGTNWYAERVFNAWEKNWRALN